MSEVIGRFAPSPSGRMHFGNIWSAVLTWLCVRKRGGKIILRIEDLDPDRCKEEYAYQFMRDLRFLGIEWDNEEIIWQSKRGRVYQSYFDILNEKKLVYPCFCSRAERMSASAPHNSDGQIVYRGVCRNLTDDQVKQKGKIRRPAYRITVPNLEIEYEDLCRGKISLNLFEECGDIILRRSDGVFAYQLAVVVDDADSGVNFVTRGSDLISSTPVQIFLHEQLGFKVPNYLHLPLLMNREGRRLSKRDGDTDMGYLSENYSREDLLGKIAFLSNQMPNDEPISLQELLEHFEEARIPKYDIMIPDNFI